MTKVVVLEDRLQEILCKIDQLGTIAWVAANTKLSADKCEQVLDDVLYGIKNLSEQISADLERIVEEGNL